MVEAAQSASRYSPSLGRFHERLAFKHGRNAAKIAVARKMLTIIFWMLTRHEPYQEPTAVTAA